MFEGKSRQRVQKPTKTKHEYNTSYYEVSLDNETFYYSIDFLTGISSMILTDSKHEIITWNN